MRERIYVDMDDTMCKFTKAREDALIRYTEKRLWVDEDHMGLDWCIQRIKVRRSRQDPNVSVISLSYVQTNHY